jgi:hypothetical protein
VLLDVNGEIGRVTMSVILVPFPKAEPASLPHPHRVNRSIGFLAEARPAIDPGRRPGRRRNRIRQKT